MAPACSSARIPPTARQWRAFEASSFAQVSLWPPVGAEPNGPQARRDYVDSMWHCAAVVGINTSAQIEAAIVGRPVFTIRDPHFAHAQDGTLHFRHLVEGDGPVRVADTLDDHVLQLGQFLDARARGAERPREFVRQFVRPHGLDLPAASIYASTVGGLSALPRRAPEPDPWWVVALRPLGLAKALLAHLLAEDRPLWVYAMRPFLAVAVWLMTAAHGPAGGWVGGRASWGETDAPGRVAGLVRGVASGRARREPRPKADAAWRALCEPDGETRRGETGVRLLFLARHANYFRSFESVIRLWAERGHQVHLAVERGESVGGSALLEHLTASYPGITAGEAPTTGIRRMDRAVVAPAASGGPASISRARVRHHTQVARARGRAGAGVRRGLCRKRLGTMGSRTPCARIGCFAAPTRQSRPAGTWRTTCASNTRTRC